MFNSPATKNVCEFAIGDALFNNSTIAASFKTSTIQSTPDIANTGSKKKNWNGVKTRKTELVKEVC
jgi:hypothetical protein